MIAYIIGRIDEIMGNSVIIECNNMGYLVMASNATISGIMRGQEIKLYTKMIVRENDISLIGFLSKQEQNMFEMLTGVTGVGIKAALSLQSSLDSSKIITAILTEDAEALSRAQGIGKKIAGRIVLELRDKLGAGGIYEYQAGAGTGNQYRNMDGVQIGSVKQDAIDTLLALGYSRGDVMRAVMEIARDGMETEQIIRFALRRLSGQ
ncbi:MAG: Holliday junction branch migration protein RuvA [Defluviitaleaceae bacterium]|nr:Holliday junction branch migration protein RuvA [Defluviitaleaceae bacterium]